MEQAFTYRSSKEEAVLIENELNSLGYKVKGYKSDASNMQDAQELIANILSDFNDINVLVNNAGITKDGLIMRMSEDGSIESMVMFF